MDKQENNSSQPIHHKDKPKVFFKSLASDNIPNQQTYTNDIIGIDLLMNNKKIKKQKSFTPTNIQNKSSHISDFQHTILSQEIKKEITQIFEKKLNQKHIDNHIQDQTNFMLDSIINDHVETLIKLLILNNKNK